VVSASVSCSEVPDSNSDVIPTEVFVNSLLHHPKILKIPKIIEDSISYLKYTKKGTKNYVTCLIYLRIIK
jgi:hypothetical protein